MIENSGYLFLDDIAIADIAFIAHGPSLSELYRQAARATTEVMLEDLDQLRLEENRNLDLEDEELEILLFDFLQELVYYKDAEQLLLLPKSVDVTLTQGGYRLQASLAGETIDPRRHSLNADIKAVSLHRFRVEPTEGGWQAAVVLDV